MLYLILCAVFDAILLMNMSNKLGTCKDNFYLTRILTAYTSGKIKLLSK